MREMGWTYEQYQQTPVRLLTEVWACITTEEKAREEMRDA